jgi:hypothetical protein
MFCVVDQAGQRLIQSRVPFAGRHCGMQFVGELEQPLMLCVDFRMTDAVFFFPVKNAHACRIGNIAPCKIVRTKSAGVFPTSHRSNVMKPLALFENGKDQRAIQIKQRLRSSPLYNDYNPLDTSAMHRRPEDRGAVLVSLLSSWQRLVRGRRLRSRLPEGILSLDRILHRSRT